VSCREGSSLNEIGAVFTKGRFARGFTTAQGVHGMTELALGFDATGSIVLVGFVVFGSADVYKVDAKGQGAGGLYSEVWLQYRMPACRKS
jgi:hypothetical protein